MKPLKKGDIVGIAASSSSFDKESFLKGVDVLQSFGLEVFFRKDIFSKERYLAGSDERRLIELTELFKNPKIKAIFFARGGYGSQRILPHFDLKIIRQNPKPVVGFSDVTPLLNFLKQKTSCSTLYGPHLTQLGKSLSQRALESFQSQLMGCKPLSLSLKKLKVLKEGRSKGPLLGGCLSLITTSIGTPYALKTKNSILFIEDTDEKLYALDRMLTQLKNSGSLKNTKALLFGSFTPTDAKQEEVEEMIQSVFKHFKGPIVSRIPSGHTDDFIPLPLGVPVAIDTHRGILQFEKPFLS